MYGSYIDNETFTSGIETSENMLEENGFRIHLNIQVDTKEIAEKFIELGTSLGVS